MWQRAANAKQRGPITHDLMFAARERVTVSLRPVCDCRILAAPRPRQQRERRRRLIDDGAALLTDGRPRLTPMEED